MSLFAELHKLTTAGPSLRWMRNTYGLSIEQVADAAHITPQALQDIEAQSVPVGPPMAALIAQTLTDLHVGKARLYCQHCDTDLGTVHAPAPPVPVTCSACRNAR